MPHFFSSVRMFCIQTQQHEIKRALVIRFSALGDLMLTLQASEALQSHGYEVHFLTKAAFAPLLKLSGSITEVHVIPNKCSFTDLVKISRRLSQFRYKFVFDLHRNIRSRIAAFFIGGSVFRISKYRLKEWFFFFFKRRIAAFLKVARIDRAQESLKVVLRQIEQEDSREKAAFFKANFPKKALDLDISSFISKAFFGRKFVCICMDSAWSEKEWDAKKFIEVAKEVVRLSYGVVWIGLKALPEEAKFSGTLDLTAQLTLEKVVTLLGHSQLLICNDSGLMHVAEAVGIPVVAVFGPTSRELGFGPRHPLSRVVEADLWCRPCSKTGRWCIRPFEKRKCLSMVGVKAVLQATEAVLAGTTG